MTLDHISPRRAPLSSLCLLLLFLSCGGCGKRRPPLPPLERIAQRTEALAAAQRGNTIAISLPTPPLTAPDASVQSIRRVDVYRLAEPLNAPLTLTEEEFATRATLVGTINDEQLRRAADEKADAVIYQDALTFGAAPTRLRYAVRYVNASDQRAAFSNFVLIEPTARVSAPPTDFAVSATQDGLNLSWTAPTANLDGSTPANVIGYNIYRREEENQQPPRQTTPTAQQKPTPRPPAPRQFVKINASPVTATNYADRQFAFGTAYRYFVRVVSLGSGAAPIESGDSEQVALTPLDVYKPPPPNPVSAAASQNRISLFFPASAATDVAGYFIYRATEPNLPPGSFTRLNATPLNRNTFADDSVEAGRTYYYYVTAVDTAGNASAPSDVVSETAP